MVLIAAFSSVLAATFDKSTIHRQDGQAGAGRAPASPVVADTFLAAPGPTLAAGSAHAAVPMSVPRSARFIGRNFACSNLGV